MKFVMDRTQYGKIDPCARQPYRCALREKGFAPGCKLNVLKSFTVFDLKVLILSQIQILIMLIP